MAKRKILRTDKPDWGGLRVWIEGEDSPLYFRDGEQPKQEAIDKAIDAREAGRTTEGKRDAIERAAHAELDKRLAADPTLFAGNSDAAIGKIFAATRIVEREVIR